MLNSVRRKLAHVLRAVANRVYLPTAQPAVATAPTAAILDSYATTAPSAQLAVDVFMREWSSELPSELHVQSGPVTLFTDDRIIDAIRWLGSDLSGMRILELGPLEGGHTYMLDRAGADVYAIESNSRGYLKCLVTKELLGLQRAKIARGDFVAYLHEATDRYDAVLASGVVYHMSEPVELLTLMAAASDRLIIWTHYYDGDILQNSPMARQFEKPVVPLQVGDATYQLHPRDYLEALAWGGFCGGPKTYANWMEREDLLDVLRNLGFDRLDISFDDPHHVNGPAFMILAERTGATAD